MLWTIITILFVLWLLGMVGHIGGGLIHLLLVFAVVVFIFNMLTGRRGTAVRVAESQAHAGAVRRSGLPIPETSSAFDRHRRRRPDMGAAVGGTRRVGLLPSRGPRLVPRVGIDLAQTNLSEAPR